MGYQRIKEVLHRIESEMRSGTMDESRADNLIRSLMADGLTSNDISFNLSADTIFRLSTWKKGE